MHKVGLSLIPLREDASVSPCKSIIDKYMWQSSKIYRYNSVIKTATFFSLRIFVLPLVHKKNRGIHRFHRFLTSQIVFTVKTS